MKMSYKESRAQKKHDSELKRIEDMYFNDNIDKETMFRMMDREDERYDEEKTAIRKTEKEKFKKKQEQLSCPQSDEKVLEYFFVLQRPPCGDAEGSFIFTMKEQPKEWEKVSHLFIEELVFWPFTQTYLKKKITENPVEVICILDLK